MEEDFWFIVILYSVYLLLRGQGTPYCVEQGTEESGHISPADSSWGKGGLVSRAEQKGERCEADGAWQDKAARRPVGGIRGCDRRRLSDEVREDLRSW